MNTTTYPLNARSLFANLIGIFVRFFGVILANAVATAKAKKLIFMVIVGGFLVSSLMGVAQVPKASPPTAPALPLDALDVLNMIADGLDSKLDNLGNSTALMGARDAILGVGLAIGLFWTGLKTMVAGKGFGELMGDWIPILITAGVVTAFTTPGVGSAGNQIVATLDKIAGALTEAVGGAAIDTSHVKTVMKSSVAATFDTIVTIIQIPRTNEADSWLNIIDVLTNIPIAMFAGLMKIVSSLIIVVAMCGYMATAVMAIMSIKLVVALAPVMVPFLIFKPTAWLFDSWLRFLLGAGMLKLVGAFMLSMTGGIMTGMKSMATLIKADAIAGTVDSYSGDIVLFSCLFLVAILCALLMAQVPSIAQGLLAGSAGGVGFSSLRGVSNTIGSRAATGVGKSAAKGTQKGAQAAMGYVQQKLAARAGHKDAVLGGPLGGRSYSNAKAKNIYSQTTKEAGSVQAALEAMEKRQRSSSSR